MKRSDSANRSHSVDGKSCPVDKQCGACQLLAIPYTDQLVKKQSEIESLFKEVVAKDGTTVLPILGMDDPFYYRNKVISPYAPGKRIGKGSDRAALPRGAAKRSDKRRSGKNSSNKRSSNERREILCGMYAQGTHRIIPTDECLLENRVAKRIILTLRDIMPKHRLEPYNENTGMGFLRHAIVRVGHQTGEVLVTLVTNEEAFPGAKSFCRDLVKRCPEITTIVQNVNKRNTNVILGDGKERTLYGPGFILDRLCGLSFRISSHSFYQVNAAQTEVLYKAAIEVANLQGTERILDAYCGTGTIGLVAARVLQEKRNDAAAVVLGVDKITEAIADARNNAKHNGISNASFFAEDAGVFMEGMTQRGESIDVLFMDPPRAGASEEFLRSTMHLQPKRIVYISCNPKTQVRDVGILQKHGYTLKTLQPVDMFPHTNHIETIALMLKSNTK